jgi:hypothetical protein
LALLINVALQRVFITNYTVDYHLINVDELIDRWSSGEVIMIKDSIHEFCNKRNKNLMSKSMLLEYFPQLQNLYP